MLRSPPRAKPKFAPPTASIFMCARGCRRTGRARSSRWCTVSRNTAAATRRSRTGAEILRAMQRIAAARAALTLPTLVYHGTDDKLTEPSGSRDFAAHAGTASGMRPALRLYEGSYHETMNDLDRERVIDALIEGVDERLRQRPASARTCATTLRPSAERL
jgi:alpha-beta hydrolase superfamily lysophospholipase